MWITRASKDSTRFVILRLHMEGRVPIHHFRRRGLQLSTGKALKGEICLSENLLTVIRTNLSVMGTGFPQLLGA